MKKSVTNIVRHADVSEKAIESYLTESVKEIGGVCLKYSNPNMVGYPDRVCLMPHGGIMWVELKSKGQKPTKLQVLRHEQLAKLGHLVSVIDSKAGVDEIMQVWRTML